MPCSAWLSPGRLRLVYIVAICHSIRNAKSEYLSFIAQNMPGCHARLSHIVIGLSSSLFHHVMLAYLRHCHWLFTTPFAIIIVRLLPIADIAAVADDIRHIYVTPFHQVAAAVHTSTPFAIAPDAARCYCH